MKKIFSFMKGYKKESVLAPLFKMLEATLELIVPVIIALTIDNGIKGGDKAYVIYMCLALAALGAIGLAFSVTAQYFAAKAAVGSVTVMRKGLFEHIQSLSYTELDTLGTSALITRMTNDVNLVQSGINLTLRLLLRSPFVVFGALVCAAMIDGSAAITFAITILLLSVVVFGIMLITTPLYKKVQTKLDGILKSTRDNLNGVRVIRAFCKEDGEIREFEEKNESLAISQRLVGRISSLLNPLTFIIINIGIILLIYVGAIKVDGGALTQGQVIALYNYMAQILVELIKLANLIVSIAKAVAGAKRIENIFEISSSQENGKLTNGNKDCEYAVEFKNVSFSYENAGAESLSGITFKAHKGATVGIIGATGSGKSTLVNLIPRFYDATRGEILIDGEPIKFYDNDYLREKIAVVPQYATLFKGTIKENLLWRKRDASDEELLSAVGIAMAKDVINAKGGLDGYIEQGARNLSGGQKQRLTIARALVGNPEILILDDSASALDFATDAALRISLKAHAKDTTVFIVSQRTSSIMHADLIIVLDEGKVCGMGTHEQLLNTCSEYREIYDSQFKKEAAV